MAGRIKSIINTIKSKSHSFWENLASHGKPPQGTIPPNVEPFYGWLYKFLIMVVAYGAIINYSLWALLGIKFNWWTPIAWGLSFYLIKYEIPPIIRSTFKG